MDKEAFLEELRKTLTKHKAAKLSKLAAENDIPVGDMIDLAFYPDKPVAFRAAWVLEHCAAINPERFLKYLNEFIEACLRQENESCRRHYSKILMNTIPLNTLLPEQAERLTEKIFEWLIDDETVVAVKANCLDILFALGRKYTWIRDELQEQIVFLLKDAGPAIQVRGKRILHKLAAIQQT